MFIFKLLIIREQSGSFEYRIQSLTEEVNALRAALNEREQIISKLRIEIRESGEKVQKVSALVCFPEFSNDTNFNQSLFQQIHCNKFTIEEILFYCLIRVHFNN